MKNDRIFNRDAWRHYRRTYSRTEFRVGLELLALLVLIALWVAWKGANPQPGLYELPGGLYEQAEEGPGRGPLPEAMAPLGWCEGLVSEYDAGNLYEKINGRADYYLSFGFERLWVISIRPELLEAIIRADEAIDHPRLQSSSIAISLHCCGHVTALGREEPCIVDQPGEKCRTRRRLGLHLEMVRTASERQKLGLRLPQVERHVGDVARISEKQLTTRHLRQLMASVGRILMWRKASASG